MKTTRNLIHPRDAIMQTMDRIYRYRMTTTSGGNLSIRDEVGDVWISPARVDKGNLTRGDIVCVALRRNRRWFASTLFGVSVSQSNLCRSPRHQSHCACASGRVGGVQHLSRRRPTRDCSTRLIPFAARLASLLTRAPAVNNWAATSLPPFGEQCDSVILENHGVVVGGESLAHAFERFEAFEFAGKTLIKANQLGKVRYLDDQQLQLAAERSIDLEPFDPPTATSYERELRRQLCEFIRRGCRQRLLISTEGSFSARVDGDAFLITPTQHDRELLNVDDLVLVNGGQRESGKLASRAAKAHQAIYAKHPGVQAIVFAHPVNATAFSVTDSTFDVRTIPESYVFLRDVKRVPYGTQYRDEHSNCRFCLRNFSGSDAGERWCDRHGAKCIGYLRSSGGSGVDRRGCHQRTIRRSNFHDARHRDR